MNDVLNILGGVLFFASGLLVWPLALLVWRRTARRTTALRLVFIAELVCQLVLLGCFLFSRGMLERQQWLTFMGTVNLVSTLLAGGAAFYDYYSGHRSPAA